jgi:hypothetical protein
MGVAGGQTASAHVQWWLAPGPETARQHRGVQNKRDKRSHEDGQEQQPRVPGAGLSGPVVLSAVGRRTGAKTVAAPGALTGFCSPYFLGALSCSPADPFSPNEPGAWPARDCGLDIADWRGAAGRN